MASVHKVKHPPKDHGKDKPKAKPVKQKEPPLSRETVFRFAEAAVSDHGINAQVSPKVLSAMAFYESTNRPKTVVDNKLYGLTQIKPDTAQKYGVTKDQLLQPLVSLSTAGKYLTDILALTHNNLKTALQQYKCGDQNYKEQHCVDYANRIIKGAQSGIPDPASKEPAKVIPWPALVKKPADPKKPPAVKAKESGNKQGVPTQPEKAHDATKGHGDKHAADKATLKPQKQKDTAKGKPSKHTEKAKPKVSARHNDHAKPKPDSKKKKH